MIGKRRQTDALALAIAAVLAAHAAGAQEDEPPADPNSAEGAAADPSSDAPADPTAGVEEFMVVGRLRSAAESLTLERMATPFSADFLGSEVISRAGDSDIGAALRRVPGLTLIDSQFVYVRGLGERYSSVLVNGAAVPSPELTRSVIPLDLFPTSIVDSIKIQKSPSPDATAAFGGGMIDIRTTSVPQAMIAQLSIGLGYNSLSDADGLTYPGKGTPLPDPIRQAIGTYRGDITVTNILSTLRATAPATITDARAIHQGLMDSLNTDIAIDDEALDPDVDAKIALGNAFDLGDNWQFGILFNGNYNDKYRNEDQTREGIGNPDTNFVAIDKTVYEERTVGALNLGLSYLEDHALELNAYRLTNDENEASISRGFDSNRQFPEQKVGYTTRLEERELEIAQISGEHVFTDTPVLTNVLDKLGMEDLEFDWFYSDATATTDVPNETRFQGFALLDPTTGQQQSTQILATTTAGQFGFLDLADDMESWGGNFRLPLDLEQIGLALSAGWWGSSKSRSYEQYLVNLNSVGVPSSVLAGDPGDVLRPGNLTVNNGFNLTVGSEFGTESYIAGQKVDAAYGMADIDLQSWRFTVGGRWETYQQAVLPIDLLDFTGASVIALQNALLNPDQRLAVEEDDVYASMAITYAGTGLLGSDDYQIRFSYGETVVRPDLREIADVIFIDPQLDVRIQGNPSLTPSPIDNFEIRSEFYYGGGDNFTISLFYKDILAPIDQVRLPGSDDDFVIGFANAESGEVSGIELEGLKMLPAGLFIAGNATLSDSEIQFDPALATDLTNQTRRLAGHSEWVINTTLGWDSENGKHSAFLNYNAFGDRIFFAGTGNNDDAYEQPFHSLGVVYKYFPTDRLQVEFKLDNILDEEREFEQVNANGEVAKVLIQEVGTNFGLSARWSF